MKIYSYGQHLKHLKINALVTPIGSASNNTLNKETTTEMGARYSSPVRIEVMMEEYMEWEVYKHCQEKLEK